MTTVAVTPVPGRRIRRLVCRHHNRIQLIGYEGGNLVLIAQQSHAFGMVTFEAAVAGAFLAGSCSNILTLGGLAAPGLVFIGLARRVRIPRRARAGFAVSLSLVLAPSRASRPSRPSIATSRASWARYFARVPAFRSSDRYLERHWWHRWYGLRLNGVAPGAPNYPPATSSTSSSPTPDASKGGGGVTR